MKINIILFVLMILIHCGSNDRDYYPLGQGYSWFYKETYIAYVDTTIGTVYRVIANSITHDDYEFWMRVDTRTMGTSEYIDTVYIRESGDTVFLHDSLTDISPDTILVFPLEVGNTWQSSEVIEQTDVTVSAGAFTDCWLIVQNGVQKYYAPNTGVVKTHSGYYTERILELEVFSKE